MYNEYIYNVYMLMNLCMNKLSRTSIFKRTNHINLQKNKSYKLLLAHSSCIRDSLCFYA